MAENDPTLSTTPNPTTGSLDGPSTLTDTADLENGIDPTGTITFTLIGPDNSVVDTETVTVDGNGIYSTPAGFTPDGALIAAGTYQWDASYSGDSNNNAVSDNDDLSEQVTVSPASPTLTTTASPTTATLDATTPLTLTDTAVLAGGYNPTGTIDFTLIGPDDSVVDTEMVTVTGNGTYSTPTGFTPDGSTGAGLYQWTANYIGDINNFFASDSGDASEQVLLTPASPTLSTAPDPTSATLDSPPTLTDSADLEGGFDPTGSITFTLIGPYGSTANTETVTVNGNGFYSTPTGFIPDGSTGAGLYQWNASYSGDGSNNTASDISDPNEQVLVDPASPTLFTTPDPSFAALDVPPLLTDSADLEGGFDPTGSITFTLIGPDGSTVDTETVTVNGNGFYSTPDGFTPDGSIGAGLYQWNASYTGDTNNNSASDIGDPAEEVVLEPASPTLFTTPDPSFAALDVPPILTDSADLEGGFDPTGSITFTLIGPDGSTVDTETVTVNGNGFYSTPDGFTPDGSIGAGLYQWNASYTGDTNNNSASDIGDPAEEVVLEPGSPTLFTTPDPSFAALDVPPILTDSADLEGGFDPTGSITFTLIGPDGSTVDTETVTVNGNGFYSTPDGFTPDGSIGAGLYQWNASYTGDTNNNSASDIGDPAEEVVLEPGSPTLFTTPDPSFAALDVPPILTDSADLEGGFDPTGSITFTLIGPDGSTVDTETVTVNGNGFYSTPDGFTPDGSIGAGLYQWNASYTGDTNNNSASDIGDPAEEVVLEPGSPTLFTTPDPSFAALDVPPILTDSADLEGGFDPTGSITFTLIGPDGSTVDTETVTVNGNGFYSTPDGFTPDGSIGAGLYQWNASYTGDTNNNSASD